MATGIKIGCRNAITFAVNQITDPTITTRNTRKSAVSAVHIVLRCQVVGYFFMRALSFARSAVGALAPGTAFASYWIELIFCGAPLLILVFACSIFSVSFLFSGSSSIAFCQ